MKWLLLFGSIFSEIIATSALKLASQGGRYFYLHSAVVIIFYVTCFALLGFCMRHFELGTIYAIWSGIGIATLALIGALFFGDQLTPIKLGSIALIIIGIVGLNLSGVSH